MSTIFTELAVTDTINADTLNDVLDELDVAVAALNPSTDLILIAGESISIRQAVRIGPDGRAYQSTGDPADWTTGLATAAAITGGDCVVRLLGAMDGFTGLTAGAVYYATTGGALAATTDGNDRVVGIALSSTRLLVHPRNYQQRSVASLARRATGLIAPLTYGGGSIVL